MPAKLTMTASDWLLLILLSILWGGAFFLVEIAVPEIPPLTLALGRCIFAAIFLIGYVYAIGLSLPSDPRVWAALLPLAAMNTVLPFSLIFWGQTHITSSLASILNASAPLFSIVLAHYATTDDRMTLARATGVAIGFVGVVVMIGVDALSDIGVNVLAQIAVVLAAFFYASAGVYGRRFKALSSSVVAATVLTIGTVLLIPVAGFTERAWELPVPSTTAIVSMLALSLLSTGLAFVIYFRVLGRAGAVNFQLVAFLIPVSAILLGVGLLGERLEPRHILGMAAIAVGLAAIDGRPWRMLKGLLGRAPTEVER